jgi:NTP pyrophosphatase (non-canonical NTP hydrolase)
MNVNENLIKQTCDHYGKETTLTVTMEECAELIQCVSKELRGQEARGHMEEEIGDVLIVISDLIYICGLDENRIQRWIDFKQNRQMGRIGMKEE